MDLKGTQTEKNLWLAFAGESQTRNKYVFYGQRALEEGYKEIADLFFKTAEHEESHAEGIYGFLNGTKDTLTNLKRSVEGERYETVTLYREYERVAREEGFEEIANYFKELRVTEAEHERAFQSLIKKLKEINSSQK